MSAALAVGFGLLTCGVALAGVTLWAVARHRHLERLKREREPLYRWVSEHRGTQNRRPAGGDS